MAAGVEPQSSCSLNPETPPRNCSHIDSELTVLPLPSSAMFIGQRVECLQHPGDVPRTGGDGGGLAALGGAGAAADHRGDAAAERLVHDLRADEVHVAVDTAGGEDLAVAGDDLGGRTDHQIGVDPRHRVGIAGLAERDDASVPNTDVRLDDSPVVDDHHAGDHGVGGALGAGRATLPHGLAQHLSAAEHRLVAGQPRPAAAVLGDLDRTGRCRRAGSGRRSSGPNSSA